MVMVTGRGSPGLPLLIHFQPPPLGGDPELPGLVSAFGSHPHQHTRSLVFRPNMGYSLSPCLETTVCVELTHRVSPFLGSCPCKPMRQDGEERTACDRALSYLVPKDLDSPKQMSYVPKTSLGRKSFPQEQHNFFE